MRQALEFSTIRWTALTEGCEDAAGPESCCNGSRFAEDADTPRPPTGLRGLPNLSMNRHRAILRNERRLPLAMLRAFKNGKPIENLASCHATSRQPKISTSSHNAIRHPHHLRGKKLKKPSPCFRGKCFGGVPACSSPGNRNQAIAAPVVREASRPTGALHKPQYLSNWSTRRAWEAVPKTDAQGK